MRSKIRYYNTHAHIGHRYKNKKLKNPYGYDYYIETLEPGPEGGT